VVRALEGPIKMVSCMTSEDNCAQFSRCNWRRPVQKVQASVSDLLDTMTLAELSGEPVAPMTALATTN
jgi:DNA-binding IscR family transcriptional regulator